MSIPGKDSLLHFSDAFPEEGNVSREKFQQVLILFSIALNGGGWNYNPAAINELQIKA
jgi:hypothetical protein